MTEKKKSITLYADDFEEERWEWVCEQLDVPTSSATITIEFNPSDVEYEDFEEDEEDEEDDD